LTRVRVFRTLVERRIVVRLLSTFSFGCALVCAAASTASAEPPRSQLQTWTTENGLPQNSVNDILQTRDGYLWLATFGGLVRFDGIRFVVFDSSVDGILTQRLMTLYEDRNGTLWAGGEDGTLVRYRDGRFTTFTPADGLPQHAAPVMIEAFADDRLWIAWHTAVSTAFDGQRFVSYTPKDFNLNGSSTSDVTRREVWWRQDAERLHALVDGRVRAWTLPAEASRYPLTGANADRQGNLWVRTSGAGVIKLGSERAERYSTSEGLPTDTPQGVFHGGRNGDIWFGSQDGVYRISQGTRELIHQGWLFAFYEDREGSIWLGTNTGLHRLRVPAFRLYTQRDGLSTDSAYSILQTRNGVVWIGTWDAGLNKLAGRRVTTLNRADGLPTERITSLFEDRRGVFWVGTTGGLGHVENDRFAAYGDREGWLAGPVWAICQDRAGAYWFGTDGGLVKLLDDRLSRYTKKDGLAHDRVFALYEAADGALWAGGANGLTRIHDGEFHSYSDRDGLVGNQVRAIHEDRDGVLWVGTYDGGLYRLANGRFTRYTKGEGLHDNGVFQIIEDGDDYFWMGSNRGISRISRRQLNDVAEGRRRSVVSQVFGVADGLASSEVNGGRQPAGMKAADGTLWFPTMGGVAVIDPSAVSRDVPTLSTIIEEIRLSGNPTPLSNGVTIAPHVAAFEIQYTAPSFVKPEQVQFRYQLVGLDDEWIDAGNRRAASFYRIPPGRYRFVVTASNDGGDSYADGGSLDLIVVAPFWRTWWFVALMFAALVSVGLTGHHRRMQRVRARQSLQRAFAQQLIDSQERERRRIAHEMHDSLSHHAAIIRTRAQAAAQAVSGGQAVGAELDEISRLAEQMKTDMHQIAYGLHPCQLEIIGLSKTLENLIEQAATAGHVRFTAAVSDIDRLFGRDSAIHIYRIVQEAVSNILAHSGATRASVTIAAQRGGLLIRVEDNGAGFGVNRFSGADRTRMGFGLMGMEERARLLGGAMQIDSTRDGTTIIVRLPAKGAADD
jgi:signal transduction histidine kinase/ligand-binding sensor domain-containing protein